MDCEKNTKIREYMQKILLKYTEIREKGDLGPDLFWDAVIISASDESQKKGYEKQIIEKRNRKEIPSMVPIHVFADPPGYKIGCGGSSMFVLDKISKIYENAFQEMKILLIPAGGYSQRLPNLSTLGKLFCPLPFGERNYQMIDLIFATYLPFLKNMSPGIFLASSDAIISYSLNDNDSWSFKNEGFTALAHPSPISIGLGHGVYVLPSVQDHFNSTSTFVSECLRVLQKPSIEEMYEKGAVINYNFGDGEQEVIFSDSTFFFDHSIVKKLISFYNGEKPLKCEISSYGDFLQPLGLNASPSYIVDKATDEELALTRSALYRNLYGTNLSILVLKNSYFHHLGTMKEYLESFCFKSKFSTTFPVSKFNFSSWSVSGVNPLYVNGTVLHSVIHPMSCLYESSLFEYCDINIGVNIGENCIISNVQIHGFSVQRLPYNIPDNALIHTAAVQSGFVTIACGINADIKKTFKDKHSFEVEFFGKTLKSALAPDVHCFNDDCDGFSLWNAKIFPLMDTPDDSLKETLKLISSENEEEMQYLYNNLDEECIKLLSLSDILILKDTEKMISYQSSLYHKIKLKNDFQKY